jgi:hypothetical protein
MNFIIFKLTISLTNLSTYFMDQDHKTDAKLYIFLQYLNFIYFGCANYLIIFVIAFFNIISFF